MAAGMKPAAICHYLLVCRQRGIYFFHMLFHQLDVQTQRLQFTNQNVEAFRNSGFGRSLALHDRFVDFRATVDVSIASLLSNPI